MSPSPSLAPLGRWVQNHNDAMFAALLALRIVNALTLRTFFQPDEFFQSLEPAIDVAFGPASGAYITWEWKNHLRSSLHPAIFAAVYQAASTLAHACGLNLSSRADLLLVAPKVLQALFAALLDWYTWKLSERAHGRASRAALTALVLSVCSPWQWFCSTRTLSNCLETSVTAAAVYHWPWHWPGPARDRELREPTQPKPQSKNAPHHILGSINQLRLSMLLAAFACILRPTNAIVWLSLSLPTFYQASSRQRYVLVREVFFCGLYYQTWTFPPFHFLYFNIAQSLAVFYGRNRADYYLTEGLPLLLTTALPFAVTGLWRALSWQHSSSSAPQSVPSSPSPRADGAPLPQILPRLAWTCIIVTLSLSLISHKEVRFLYPILPFLHILAAQPTLDFFLPTSPRKKLLLSLVLLTNLSLSYYTSQIHQRGVIDVLTHLRHQHESKNNLAQVPFSNSSPAPKISPSTIAFLMPCHSTPWRSHLIYPHISAWSLTCEPPLSIPLSARTSYLDEADLFYLNPTSWLATHMQHVHSISSSAQSGSRSSSYWASKDPKYYKEGRREWPMYLVFFGQLESELRGVLDGSRYKECWRGFNSHWHDDWRREGDVVVWCLG